MEVVSKPINNVPVHASSHAEACLIHHLSWAAVAVAWVMAVGDPLTKPPDGGFSPQDPFMATGGDVLSEQRVPNAVGDFFGSAVLATSFHRGTTMAAKTEGNALESHCGCRLTLEETLETIEQMEQVPLSASEKQDLAEILDF